MLQPEIRCVEFVEQITEWLEGGLPDDGRLLFEEHLAYCSPCDRYVAQFRLALTLVRDAATNSESPEPVRDALLEAFRQNGD